MSDVKENPAGFVQARQRSGAITDPKRLRLLGHMRGTAPTPPPVPPKPTGYETKAQEKERKQKAESEIARQVREDDTNQKLGALGDDETMATLRGILAESEQQRDREAAVFRNYMFVADLDRAPAEKRQKDFAAIVDVLDAVGDRCQRFDSAIAELRQKKVPQDVQNSPKPEETAEIRKALGDASRLKGLLTAHIPEEFWAERNTLPNRRDAIMASPEEKKKKLEQEKAGFPEGAKYGERFKEIIQPHLTKGFERSAIYADRLVGAVPPEQLQELAVMVQKIIAKAYRIRDAGGKLADVEAMMQSTGIPPAWWPPNFVQSLQAWRKAEREVLRRNVQELCAEKLYDMSSPSDIARFVKDQAHMTGSNAKQMFAQILETGEVKAAIGEFVGKLKTGFGLGKEAANALESNEYDNLDPKLSADLYKNIINAETKLSGVIDKVSSAFSQAKDLPSNLGSVTAVLGSHAPGVTNLIADHMGDAQELSNLAASFVPGLALAAAGVQLGLALAELAKQSVMMGFAVSAENESIGRVARGELEDGFALTYAMQNEQKARGVAIGKAGVKVTTTTMDVVGAGAEVGGGHFGVAAKYGLKISGKVITYGSQVVFNGIEWGMASTAKELLAQARAGNDVARIEIFKHSATYAKLYIAILVRENDPTALDYVERCGIDESTISNEANAVWILEKAIRADSGQRSDEEVPDGFLDALSGGTLSKIAGVGKKIAGGVGAAKDKVHDLRKGDERGKPYDPNWRFKGSIAITAASWRAAKDAAYAAGLQDDHGTGASDAVADAEKTCAAADQALTGTDKAAIRAALQKAMGSLDKFMSVLVRWTPMSNPNENDRQVAHAGMTDVMVELRSQAARKIVEYDTKLQSLGIKNTGYQPGIGSQPLDDADWKRNWQGGVQQACLPQDDGGMGKALAEAMKQIRALDGNDRKKDPQDWRRANLALRDALDAVLDAAEAVRRPVIDVPAMTAYVERIASAATARMRTVNDDLAADWPAMPQPPTTVSSAAWKSFYDSACTGGAAKKGDGAKITSALETLEKMEQTIAKREDDPQKQVAAELTYREATGKLMLAAAEFLRGQPDVAEPLRQYVIAVGAFAQNEQATKASTQKSRVFTPRPNLTRAAWEETYENAVKAGAVVANGKIKSAVGNAMADYEKKAAELQKQRDKKDYKATRTAAMDVRISLGKLAAAINQAMADRGFKDNDIMSQYCAQRLQRIRGAANEKALLDAANGKGAPADAFKPVSPTWDLKPWEKARDEAKKLGIILDADTGMTPLIKAASGAIESLRSKRAKAKSEKDKVEARAVRDDTLTKIAGVSAMVKGPLGKLSEHPGWDAYMKAWVLLCDNTRKSSDLAEIA